MVVGGIDEESAERRSSPGEGVEERELTSLASSVSGTTSLASSFGSSGSWRSDSDFFDVSSSSEEAGVCSGRAENDS